jgi:hypothetical protein
MSSNLINNCVSGSLTELAENVLNSISTHPRIRLYEILEYLPEYNHYFLEQDEFESAVPRIHSNKEHNRSTVSTRLQLASYVVFRARRVKDGKLGYLCISDLDNLEFKYDGAIKRRKKNSEAVLSRWDLIKSGVYCEG